MILCKTAILESLVKFSGKKCDGFHFSKVAGI